MSDCLRVSLQVMQPLPEDRFLCGFSHIFAGGYSAGYFSYKWAEVLSADAFSAFEDVGLDNQEAVAETGRRFADTVLALVSFHALPLRRPAPPPPPNVPHAVSLSASSPLNE